MSYCGLGEWLAIVGEEKGSTHFSDRGKGESGEEGMENGRRKLI